MNPFKKLKEIKDMILANAKAANKSLDDTLTYREHYNQIVSILNIIENELKNAEYNYKIESLKISDIHVFGELTVKESELNDEILLFQPLSNNGELVTDADLQSLYDILLKMRDKNQITKNMIVIPQYMNVLKAVLANEDEDDKENTSEEDSDI